MRMHVNACVHLCACIHMSMLACMCMLMHVCGVYECMDICDENCGPPGTVTAVSVPCWPLVSRGEGGASSPALVPMG